jgi:hypothetical protein
MRRERRWMLVGDTLGGIIILGAAFMVVVAFMIAV